MNFLLKLILSPDQFLLYIAEKFSHWFQRLTGRTNFFLSKIAAATYCLLLIIDTTESIRNHKPLYYQIINWLVIVAVFKDLINYYENVEITAMERLEKGLANPLKGINRAMILRVIIVYFILFVSWLPTAVALVFNWITRDDLSEWYNYSENLVFICWIYFMSCDSLPPCSGKIWGWFGKLFRQKTTAVNEA